MTTYYCSSCRHALGFTRGALTGPLIKTAEQRRKHKKHTQVKPSVRLQSVFRDPSTSAIRVEVDKALAQGAVEVDSQGKVNLLTRSGPGFGVRYEYGQPIEQQDLTKVVLSSNVTTVHQFPESRDRLGGLHCAQCGGPIV